MSTQKWIAETLTVSELLKKRPPFDSALGGIAGVVVKIYRQESSAQGKWQNVELADTMSSPDRIRVKVSDRDPLASDIVGRRVCFSRPGQPNRAIVWEEISSNGMPTGRGRLVVRKAAEMIVGEYGGRNDPIQPLLFPTSPMPRDSGPAPAHVHSTTTSEPRVTADETIERALRRANALATRLAADPDLGYLFVGDARARSVVQLAGVFSGLGGSIEEPVVRDPYAARPTVRKIADEIALHPEAGVLFESVARRKKMIGEGQSWQDLNEAHASELWHALHTPAARMAV